MCKREAGETKERHQKNSWLPLSQFNLHWPWVLKADISSSKCAFSTHSSNVTGWVSCKCVLNKLFNKDNCPKHFMNELKQTIKHRNRLKYLPEGRAMFVQPSQYMNVQIKVPIISFPAECQCWQWMSSLNDCLETSPPPKLPSMSISRKSFTSIYTVGARVSSTFMG